MAVDQILRRNFGAVPLVFVVATALLNAKAVGRLVGVVLSPEPAQLAIGSLASERRAAGVADPSPRETSADAIFARNPFDSETGPLDAQLLQPTSGTAADFATDLGNPMNAPACDGVKVLIITKAENPEWSFAAFSEANDQILLRRRDGDVGDKKVELIGWDRVWLRTANARCQAKLFDPAAGAMARPAEKKSAVVASTLDPVIANGIRKTGASEYEIDGAALDRIIDNQSDLMRAVRIVPAQGQGKTVGIRMFGVKEGTLLGLLGMEDGDRLQQINGFDLTSPERALEAYARLRTAERLTVQVNRRGVDQNLDYLIKR